MEQWKNIKGYSWLYQVSNEWRIKSLWNSKKKKEKILKLQKMKDLRLKVLLYKNNTPKRFFIHRLVAQAFLWLNINDNKTVVCHKDDDPTNNFVTNLFTGTQKDNMQDAKRKWRMKPWLWANLKLTPSDVINIRKEYTWKYWEQKYLSEKYKIHESEISRILNWKRWSSNILKIVLNKKLWSTVLI